MADVPQVMRKTANPGFRFAVNLGAKSVGAFTEVVLPAVEWDVLEIKEGGQNFWVHQVPGRRKGGKLTLKNGLGKDDLVQWCLDTMNETFERRKVTVTMLGVDHKEVMRWHLEDALPVKWSFPTFKPDTNAIAIQSIELVCHHMEVEKA